MLSIKTKNGYIPLTNIQNFSILTEYEGDLLLSFDIPTKDKCYKLLKEESSLKFEDNNYLVKSINQRKKVTTITAKLDFNEWKVRIHQDFHTEYRLFSEVLLVITPIGWIFEADGAVTGRRALTLVGVTDYEILMECKKLYGIVLEYHTAEKRIKAIKPDVIQPRGLYISDELNLQDVEYKGDTAEFATRLYAYGKKTEEKDEESNITSTTYVTFASINDGKPYVDNNTYCNDVISLYWQDDRYLDPQELLNDAIDKLKILSTPTQSYSCKLKDLSRLNEKYRMLDFQMYDKTTLIDSSGINVMHQIVQYKRYPLQEGNNEVTLSTEFKKITGTIDNITTSLGSIDASQKRTENSMNEIIRDVQSNTLRIENTYTKGEIDIKEESIVQQANDSISLAVEAIEEKIQKIDVKTIQLDLLKDGTVLNNDVPKIKIYAQVMQNSVDITSSIPNVCFTWQRKTNDASADKLWDEAHKHIKEISVGHEDITVSASFQCIVQTSAYTKYSGYETIIVESNLTVRLDANLPLYQHYAKGVLDPSWNPLLITPEVKDGALLIPLEQCEIAWRRADGDLQIGEVVEDGVLKVTQNKLSEVSSKSITYICTVKHKSFITLDSISFTLITDGESGKGIVSITNEYYLSTSKEAQEGGEWISTAPVWSSGMYIWTRTKSVYTDETISYTNPICDATWEVVNDLEDKVNDKIDKDISSSEQRITETYESALNLTKEEIGLSVGKIEESLGSATEIIKGVQNQLEITSEATSFIKTTVDKLTDVVDGKVDEATIKEWARFDGSSLELGASNSPFKAILSNTELAFWQGNTKVAWISNNELHIAHAVVMETLRIGSFQMQHIRGTGLVLNRWE